MIPIIPSSIAAQLPKGQYIKLSDVIAEQKRQYREKNREKVAEHHRQYYEKNREKVAELERQSKCRRILKEHHELLKDDPEHLSTEFLKNIIDCKCKRDGDAK